MIAIYNKLNKCSCGEAVMSLEYNASRSNWHIRCLICDASGPGSFNGELAVSEWNKLGGYKNN